MMTKRIFSALLAAALSLSLLAGCGSTSGSTASSAADGPQRYSTVFYDVFDTVTQVIAYCESEEEFNTQMQALHQDLIAYNQLYDIYNDYDGVVNVKTINENAGKAPVQVDDRILSMLELARQMYELTSGKINIAMGSVLGIWHDYREAAEKDASEADNTLPTQEELESAAQHCDINDLVIDEEAKTVYLSDPEMSLDVGSVGKGYAVEQAAQAAEARGLTSALISVGGNLRAIGTKPDGSQWVGGVENPWNSSEVYTNGSSTVAAVKMSDLALVTSGDYQRYYVVDGKRYHHLIDPATLWPAAYFDGVSVLAPDSGMADCLTTGLFCLPLDLLCQTHLFFHLSGLLFDPDTNADILPKRLQFFVNLTDPDTIRFAPVEPLPFFGECLHLFFQWDSVCQQLLTGGDLMLLEEFHLLDPGIQFPDVCPKHRGDPFGLLL